MRRSQGILACDQCGFAKVGRYCARCGSPSADDPAGTDGVLGVDSRAFGFKDRTSQAKRNRRVARMLAFGVIVSPLFAPLGLTATRLGRSNKSNRRARGVNFPAANRWFFTCVAIDAVFIIGSIVLWFLFFGRSKLFPAVAITMWWVFVLWGIASVAWAGSVFHTSDAGGQMGGGILATILWTRYLLRSKRAKETFVL